MWEYIKESVWYVVATGIQKCFVQFLKSFSLWTLLGTTCDYCTFDSHDSRD